MTNKEAVSLHWNKLKEEMVQQMNFQMQNYKTIRYADLNKLYKSKIQRWDGSVQPEGRWLQAQNDKERTEKMLGKLGTFDLKEPSVVQNNMKMPLLAGAGAGLVCGFAVNAIVGAVVFIGVSGVLSTNAKKNKEKQLDQLKADYTAQIMKHGQELAEIWED